MEFERPHWNCDSPCVATSLKRISAHHTSSCHRPIPFVVERMVHCKAISREGSCVFGCPGEAQDSIEHYAFCPVQVSFARDRLHIPAQHTAAVQSFLVLGHNLDDTLQTMLLLNLYCCYSARNAIKNHVEPRAQQNLHECMLQFAHQGTFGHSASQRVLASSGARKFGRPAAATAPGRGRNTFVSGGRLVTGSEWR